MLITSRLRAYVLWISVLLASAMLLIGCGGGSTASTNYAVSGTLDIKPADDVNRRCEGTMPDKVRVYLYLYQTLPSGDERRIGYFTKSGNTFPSNGPFTITTPWPDMYGKPDGWRIEKVVRDDDTPICENPAMKCDPASGHQCQDTEMKLRSGAIGTPADWKVRCACQ